MGQDTSGLTLNFGLGAGSDRLEVGTSTSLIGGYMPAGSLVLERAKTPASTSRLVVNAPTRVDQLLLTKDARLVVNNRLDAEVVGLLDTSRTKINGDLKFDYLLAEGSSKLNVRGSAKGKELSLTDTAKMTVTGRVKTSTTTLYDASNLKLNGVLRTTDALILNGGELRGKGTLQGDVLNNSATISPGKSMVIRGDLTQAGGSLRTGTTVSPATLSDSVVDYPPFSSVPSINFSSLEVLSGLPIFSAFTTAPPPLVPFATESVVDTPSIYGGVINVHLRSRSNYDRLKIKGTANLGGSYIYLTPNPNLLPNVGDRYKILTASEGIEGKPKLAIPSSTDQRFSPNYFKLTRSENAIYLELDQRKMIAGQSYGFTGLPTTATRLATMQLSQLENNLLNDATSMSLGVPVTAGNSDDSKWRVLAEGFGSFSDDQYDDYETKSGLIGASYAFQENLHAGLYFGYGETKDTIGSNPLLLITERFGFFASWTAPQNLYLYGLLGGAIHQYEYSRTSLAGTSHSRPSGTEFDSLLGTGYDLHLGIFSAGPFASLQYVYQRVDGMDESGSEPFNLRYGSQSTESLLSTLGLKAAANCSIMPQITFAPMIRVAWQDQFLDTGSTVDVGSTSANSPILRVSSPPETVADTILVAGGFSIDFKPSLSLSAYYTASREIDAEFDNLTHAAQAAIQYRW